LALALRECERVLATIASARSSTPAFPAANEANFLGQRTRFVRRGDEQQHVGRPGLVESAARPDPFFSGPPRASVHARVEQLDFPGSVGTWGWLLSSFSWLSEMISSS
jgi:hypothetical protein